MKKTLAVLLAIICVISLCACGSAKKLVGQYKAVSVESDGQVMEGELVEGLLSSFKLEIKDGNKAVMSLGDEEKEFDVSLKGDKVTISKDGEGATGTYKDGKLTLEIEGEKIVFEKQK